MRTLSALLGNLVARYKLGLDLDVLREITITQKNTRLGYQGLIIGSGRRQLCQLLPRWPVSWPAALWVRANTALCVRPVIRGQGPTQWLRPSLRGWRDERQSG